MEEPAESDEPDVPVWPPRISNPPRLPFMSDEYMDLALDPLGKAPEPPEFTPVRLNRHKVASAETPAGPTAVLYDRRNPSGRTRGDRVLRPTDDDRTERQRRKRREAALTAAAAGGVLTFILASPTALLLATVVLVASLAGWMAYELGDSEISWAASMGLVGVPLGWHHGLGGILICFLFLTAAGWFTGFVRDANMS